MSELLISFAGDRYASPAYLRHAQYWRFLRASYLGGRAWYDQGNTAQFSIVDPASSTHHKEQTIREQAYLARHAREPDVFYQLRFRSSVYWNFMRSLVDGMASTVAGNARKTSVPAAIGHVLSETGGGVDGHGKDLADFDRELGVDLIRYGMVHTYIVLPSPLLGGGGKASIDSVADERDLGLVPHARTVSPIDLLRWQSSPEIEEYEWALMRERVPATITPLIDGSAAKPDVELSRYRFRLLRRDGWTLYDEAGNEIDSGPGMGFVPLVTTVREQHPLEAEPIGVSLVEDVAELAKLVYNKFSWLTEEQRNHAFNQWFLKSPNRLTPEQQVLFGSATYIGGFEDAKILAPSVAPMEHLEDSLQHDIRRRARGILGLDADGQVSGVKSGLAISLERAESEATLAGLAKTFETAKRRWLRLMARVAGADPEEVVVRVDRDFSELAAVGRQTQILAALKDAALPPKAKAVLQKELLVGLLPNLSLDARRALDMAIDAAMEPEPVRSVPAQTGGQVAQVGGITRDRKGGTAVPPFNAVREEDDDAGA